jgi:hypothetical protein
MGVVVITLMKLRALEFEIDFLLEWGEPLVCLLADVVPFLLIKSVHGNDRINHLKPSAYYTYQQV